MRPALLGGGAPSPTLACAARVAGFPIAGALAPSGNWQTVEVAPARPLHEVRAERTTINQDVLRRARKAPPMEPLVKAAFDAKVDEEIRAGRAEWLSLGVE